MRMLTLTQAPSRENSHLETIWAPFLESVHLGFRISELDSCTLQICPETLERHLIAICPPLHIVRSPGHCHQRPCKAASLHQTAGSTVSAGLQGFDKKRVYQNSSNPTRYTLPEFPAAMSHCSAHRSQPSPAAQGAAFGRSLRRQPMTRPCSTGTWGHSCDMACIRVQKRVGCAEIVVGTFARQLLVASCEFT